MTEQLKRVCELKHPALAGVSSMVIRYYGRLGFYIYQCSGKNTAKVNVYECVFFFRGNPEAKEWGKSTSKGDVKLILSARREVGMKIKGIVTLMNDKNRSGYRKNQKTWTFWKVYYVLRIHKEGGLN